MGKLTASNKKMISSRHLDKRFHQLLFQIEQLDKKLQSKTYEMKDTVTTNKEVDEFVGTVDRCNNTLLKKEGKLREQATRLKKRSAI